MIAISIREEDDIIIARGEARRLAEALGMGLVDKTRLATAVSELARNIFNYAGQGRVELEVVSGPRQGVLCRFIDQGPGIANLELALSDGWSSGQGLGYGLPGARRLADLFAVTSEPGKGTTVEITKWM